jgi:hypothetical protein
MPESPRPPRPAAPIGAPDERPAAGPPARDRRLGYGQGWVLIAGMVALATVFLGIVWNAAPRAWRGWLVGGGAALAFAFLAAPAAAVFTRRLLRRAPRRPAGPPGAPRR